MKIWSRIPRHSLLWLSHADIATVRNRLVALFLKPGETIEVAPPAGFFNVSPIRIIPAISPCFEFQCDKINYRVWLKFPDRSLPKWDIQCGADFGDGPQRVKFNDPLAAVPAAIIKGLTSYFPFVPSSNFYLRNGEFLA